MVFADLDLARRLEGVEASGAAGFVEARLRLSPNSGAQWIEAGGAYALFDGADSPVTQTFGLGLSGNPSDADLKRIETFFLDRGSPVCQEISPLAGVPLAERLTRRGYRPIEFTSVMYKEIDGAPEVPVGSPAPLATRQMAAGEEELWSRVSGRGWSEHPEFTKFIVDFGRVLAEASGTHCFFAHLDGQPVATAVLRCHGGVAMFGGAATIPEARRQGAQRALLDVRMRAAARERCDLAMMCAEPGSSSQRNAERLGFRIAYTRTKWRLDAIA